jgi:DNA-binding GntR family transcriptional regulator
VIDLVLERAKTEPLDFSLLDDRVAQMRQLLKARDIVTFYERDIEYHRALWHLAGDEYLSQLLEQIVVPLFAFFIMVNRDPRRQFEEIAIATEVHQEIADGLKARSPEAARRAFQKLLDTSLVFSGGPKAEGKDAAGIRKRRAAK